MIFPDPCRVAELIRATARDEIMPRFGKLGRGEVREKKPGDPVTVADTAAEARLARELVALSPGSVAVGEEAADADPRRVDALAGEAPVWLLDPLDGTSNFVQGIPCFAVMVAYCRSGDVAAAWIHDPVSGSIVSAVAGGGAWRDHRQLRLPAPPALGEQRGSMNRRLRLAFAGRRRTNPKAIPEVLERHGCVGHEYMDLGSGQLHFAQYGGRLKPWDHAGGYLIHREAGGFAALASDGRSYRPGDGIFAGDLLLAPDAESWHALRRLIVEIGAE
jgi:fructose-1,6-bisphosphatase/inositol monophosphatase family enzyme